MDTEKERATGIGHTFGVRVDGAAPRGLWPPAGGGLCRRVVKGKVLRIDGPFRAQGFLSLTAFQAEGCGIARRAMLMKSALRINLSASYVMKSILVISRYAAPPYPAAPDFPPSGGQNKTPRNTLFINGSTVSTDYCATACGGKVVAPATKGGLHFLARQGGCMVFLPPQAAYKTPL